MLLTTHNPDPNNLRSEYSVIGSYVTQMTGMRFQTIAIYLAALGLVFSRGAPSSPTAGLILVVSVGLWILDLRNRDLLKRLGERGRTIEQVWGYQKDPTTGAGGAGFFHDETVPARLRLFTADRPFSDRLSPRLISHALGIDLIFVAVIVYAVALLALPGY